MADPTPYSRGFSFTDYQEATPQNPLPGPNVDVELDEIAGAVAELVDAVKDVRRSDGALRNQIVTLDSVAPSLLPGILAQAEAAAGSKAAAVHADAVAAAGSAEDAADILSETNALAVLVSQNANGATVFNTRASAVATSIPALVASVVIRGYNAVGDGGGGLYQRIAAPSTVRKFHFQTADGAWWQLVDRAPEIRQFGAVGNNVTDDTLAFQHAARYHLECFGGGGIIRVGFGFFYLTAPIECPGNLSWEGGGYEVAWLMRRSGYGDTFRYINQGIAVVRGLRFTHGDGSETLNNLDHRLTDGSAHIRLQNTGQAFIEKCLFVRMPFGIVSDGGHNTHIYDNIFSGRWDRSNVNLQETLYDVYLCGSTQHGQLCKIRGNYFAGGAYLPSRSITYSDGAHSVTTSYPGNIGALRLLMVESCEDLSVNGNYFGRGAEDLILIAPGGSNPSASNIRIVDNFFDDAGNGTSGNQIRVVGYGGPYVLGLSIAGNTFNGEYDTYRAITVEPGAAGSPCSVSNLAITGNDFFAHVSTPILLGGVSSGTVTGNTISNYNSLNVSPLSGGDRVFSSAIYCYGGTRGVNITGNTLGGGGNDAGAGGNYCYNDVTVTGGATNVRKQGNTNAGVTRWTAGDREPGYVVGQEYLTAFRKSLMAGTGTKTVFSGDSTTQGPVDGSGNPIWANRIDALVTDMARDKGFIGVTAYNRGHSGETLSVNWLNLANPSGPSRLHDDMNDVTYGGLGAVQLYSIRWGINDQATGRTLDQFEDTLRAGLAELRVYYPVTQLSILLCTPNSTSDQPGSEAYYEALRPIFERAAHDYQCCFIDIYSWMKDNRTTSDWADTVTGGGHIHPTDVGALSIFTLYADTLFPSGFTKHTRNRAGFRAIKSADQTGVVPAALTKVTFPSEARDNGGYYDPALSRFTPPPGSVRGSAGVYVSGLVAGQLFLVEITKNGGTIAGERRNASGTSESISVPLVDYASGTDYYEVYVYAEGAGNKTVISDLRYTYFTGDCGL